MKYLEEVRFVDLHITLNSHENTHYLRILMTALQTKNILNFPDDGRAIGMSLTSHAIEDTPVQRN